ncbi:MotA/TolQ/ExbB proton channel family protein [Shewanella sp.]|uniref:MotA/TolQ/ExbB proton channel family protein n=1 Tax=Shewanella sp. TaxID=50422 RepID=UPI004053B584
MAQLSVNSHPLLSAPLRTSFSACLTQDVISYCRVALASILKGLVLLASLYLGAVNSATLASVESEILTEIKQSNQAYQRQLRMMTTERQGLLQQLAEQERKLKTLSTKAASITRGQDEQSMSLASLAQRLQSWKQQQDYLKHLLSGISSAKAIETPQQLSAYLAGFAKPSEFIKQDIALSSGELISGAMLSLGPMHWFISDDGEKGGLLTQVEQQWQLALSFDEAQLAQLSAVKTDHQGVLAIDPSNNRSLVLAQHQESFAEHLGKGGIWVIPIMGFALLALIIALVKAVTLFRLEKVQPFSQKVQPFSQRGEPLSQLAGAGLKRAALGQHQQALADIAKQYPQIEARQQRDDLLLDSLIQTKREIERGLTAIAVTASVAPLLGLLGTVSGMIQTFKLMTLFGAGDANAVSGGISESLVTTELGLIVAIPALIAHALMSRRCHHFMAGLESYAVALSHHSIVGHNEPIITSHSKEAVHVA